MKENTREALLILQEECSEVIQAASKCFRFGPDQIKPGKSKTNMEHLEEELGDLLAMIELLQDSNVGVTREGLQAAKMAKFEKLRSWSNIKISGK
jgi:NTP pyrophosphatase (non-canonical NTP hydrolase)